MVWLMALFSAALAACGLGLFGLGVGMTVGHEVGGGLVGVTCGTVTLYGAYLFGRASRHTRAGISSEEAENSEARARRADMKLGGRVGLLAAASVAVAPVPIAAKAVSLIIVALGVFVGVATRVEPTKTPHES
jgi:hypothetical protein